MEEEQKLLSQPKWMDYVSKTLVGVVCVGALIYLFGEVLPSTIKHSREQNYAVEHLDSNAFTPKENPFPSNDFFTCGVFYKDIDNDGDYESILKRKNSDGEFVEMPFRKGLEGKTEFPNLSKKAIDPLILQKNPHLGLKLDYVDIDKDGKLESITYSKTPYGKGIVNVTRHGTDLHFEIEL